jgi:tetratricopeptide (TPR) repeat protein
MRRPAAVLLLSVALLGLVGVSRASLESEGAGSVPAGLLYLPEGPYLRALAFGHEETLADLLYIWAIQYYSNYEDSTRHEYLDRVFRGAITELDPLFTEPYLVGAMIMTLEARRRDEALALYDKGLENMPGNWEIAYWAGWECYFARDYLGARRYWLRAAGSDGAPPWFSRLAARMLEKAGDLESAVAEYRALMENARDEETREMAKLWLERATTEADLERADRALDAYRARTGRCPLSLDELVAAGDLETLPSREGRGALVLDRSRCRALPAPGDSIEGAR